MFSFLVLQLIIGATLVNAVYVGIATVAGFVWWFVYSDSGPKLPYMELVSTMPILEM